MLELASNNTPIAVLRETDWETDYGRGKFDTVAAEKLYAWTLDSIHDDECGNAVDWYWWAAKFDDERVILEAVSDGFVTAIRYNSDLNLAAAWEERERQYEEYRHAECEDGMDCEGCFSCENA